MTDGYSGIAFWPDDWYDEEYGVVWPEPNRYTNKWAYYSWYYDYQYYEQWASLDDGNKYWPASSFGIWWSRGRTTTTPTGRSKRRGRTGTLGSTLSRRVSADDPDRSGHVDRRLRARRAWFGLGRRAEVR